MPPATGVYRLTESRRTRVLRNQTRCYRFQTEAKRTHENATNKGMNRCSIRILRIMVISPFDIYEQYMS